MSQRQADAEIPSNAPSGLLLSHKRRKLIYPEDSMVTNERRLSQRIAVAVPLEFRTLPNTNKQASRGETLNLSEHGVLFTCDQKYDIGTPLEMSFAVLQALTGRAAEPVKCTGRVVHVQNGPAQNRKMQIGVQIEKFEPAVAALRFAS
jgi:Tfp pilus assembly protein PilZ